MSESFLLDHFDDHGCAILERPGGIAISIPVKWLPAEAREGHTLQMTLSPGAKNCNIQLELVEGNTDPTGVNVGG
jgi:hypothetical protein